VIQTRKVMEQAEELTTLVDSETSMTNVTRMAEKAGWQATVAREGDDFVIGLTKGVPVAEALPQVVGRAEAADGPAVLVVSGEIMGRGSAELGNILVRGFFHTLAEVEPRPQVAILFNAGVKLACEGSPVLDDLRALESDGLQILVCGTCLGYFELTERLSVGQVSNMYDIAETMFRAGKVVHL
jgi:selenium metabolism protein YedF